MGSKGQQAPNVLDGNSGLQGLQGEASLENNPALMQALQGYSSGSLSLQDALSSLQGGPAGNNDRLSQLEAEKGNMQARRDEWGGAGPGADFSGINSGDLAEIDRNIAAEKQRAQASAAQFRQVGINQLASNPLTGSKLATDQVRDNPLFSGYFGQGGLQDQLLGEQKDLDQNGWSLTAQDNTALGQASDNIARLSGQEDSSLAQALASRGLAAGASGAAGVGYSGLAGNKLERLAQSQRQIADDRMATNLQRLNSVRQQALQVGQLGQNAVQNQFDRNQTGVNQYRGALKDSLTAGQIQQGQQNAGFNQQQQTKGPGFGDIVAGVGGTVLGSASGALGTSLGGGLGQALGGIVPNQK